MLQKTCMAPFPFTKALDYKNGIKNENEDKWHHKLAICLKMVNEPNKLETNRD